MTEDPQEIIIEYPEAFPITEPLREVFTERLRTFFTVATPPTPQSAPRSEGR